MKRGILTMLAAAAFFTGHFAATACQASMTVPAPRKSEPVRSCCRKHVPAPAKTPAPKPCCCADGTDLVVVEYLAAQPQSAPAVAVEWVDSLPVEVPARGVAVGRPPPVRAPDVPLYTLHATLLI